VNKRIANIDDIELVGRQSASLDFWDGEGDAS